MLPHRHRLTKKKDFEQVFKKGKSTRDDLCLVRYVSTDNAVTRVGFVVSKKVSPKAVERNLVKRRMRAVVTELLKDITTSVDVVVIAHSGAKTATLEKLTESLKGHFTALSHPNT